MRCVCACVGLELGLGMGWWRRCVKGWWACRCLAMIRHENHCLASVRVKSSLNEPRERPSPSGTSERWLLTKDTVIPEPRGPCNIHFSLTLSTDSVLI